MGIAYDGHGDNGYATKQIRIALAAIDVVEPYVEIVKYGNRRLPSDIIPLQPLQRVTATTSFKKQKKRVKTKPRNNRKIRWTVGGAVKVDETFLIYGLWENFERDFPSFGSIDQLNQAD